MRGSVEPVAVARDVASSSPSKPPSALDMMRYQRISPDCLPLANGGGSRKPTPAAPRSSKDDDAPAVATDSSRLASYLTATSLGPKPRARAPQPQPPPPAPASAPPSSSMTRSPARDHSHHYPSSDFPDPTSPSSTGGGPSGSAGHDATMLLQWGQNKRSRGRRDASAVSASASASASTPSPQRRQAAVKIQHRSSAPAEKLMPPPSYPRGSNLRVSSFLPARGGVVAHHGRNAHPHHRSVEERAGGQSSSAAAGASRAEKQQRPGADKADAGAMVTGTQESKHQQGGGGGHQAEHHGPGSSSKAAAAQKQLPRIYTTLSRKEKEEDFLAMKGTKLPQRPKKRPKAVERAVNFICPGTWLSDVTRSRYEVREKKCTKKQKRRGLKGMEMDSDSD